MITGIRAKGAIKWGVPPGWYTAAAIEGYAIAPCNRAGTLWDLVATVVLHDKFKMAQRPLTFVARRTKKGLDGRCVVQAEWRWPILSLSPIDPNTYQLTARLGPPEET